MPTVADAPAWSRGDDSCPVPRLQPRFWRGKEVVSREIELPDEQSSISTVPDRAAVGLDAAAAFDQSWLRNFERPATVLPSASVRCADLFCGVGGLSVGLEDAAWSLGLSVEHVFAADVDRILLERYEANFGVRHRHAGPIEALLDGELGQPETPREQELVELLGSLDVALAGPPCQGHSDLNNHTRRDDPRNALLLRVVRLAEISRPRTLLIENVPGARHDRDGVIQRATTHLESLGYAVDLGVLKADEVGVAQRRRRFFLLASLGATPSLVEAVERWRQPARSVMWAIDGLDAEGDEPFDTPAIHSEENQRRISYLFENGLYDLPDKERPACHRDKPHSYRAVYGRMRPDEPAPTITVGFGSTGQGRFVHPHRRRTLTPHEAARVQSFPDWFDFTGLRRGQLQKAIGNAVPPRMASAVVSELLLGVWGS